MRREKTPVLRARLAVEELEGRWIPSAYRWEKSPFRENVWTGDRNWYRLNPETGSWSTCTDGDYPGKDGRTDDTATFNVQGTLSSQSCVLNVPVTLKTLLIEGVYKDSITLQQTLTIKGGTLKLANNDATLMGDQLHRKVDLDGATFSWYRGSLQQLDVNVGQGSTLEVPTPGNWEDGQATPYLCMSGTNIDVKDGGTLSWQWRNVRTAFALDSSAGNRIEVYPTGEFNISVGSHSWGSTSSSALEVRNRGTVTARADDRARFIGSFWNQGSGTVYVMRGTLELAGPAVQDGDGTQFDIRQGAKTYPNNPDVVLDIRAGKLTGSGKVEGSVILGGGATGSPKLQPQNDNGGPGLFTITCLLDMRRGEINIDIFGQTTSLYDRVSVGGYAALADTVTGTLRGVTNDNFNAGDKINFLKYGSRQRDFTNPLPPPGWATNKDATQYWFERGSQIAGRAARDGNGNGVFEPELDEVVLAGVGVTLLDSTGTEVDYQTTDAEGQYDFGGVLFGSYTVVFAPPSDLRPSPQHAAGAAPDMDSDIDLYTYAAAVTLTEANPTSEPNTDALFRPLTAVNDAYTTPYQTAVAGNVLANDPPATGDTLTVSLGTGPTHGSVVLNANGSFTYTPATGYYGTDTFTYVVTDYYGLTATATVAVTVTPPPATISGRVFSDGFAAAWGSFDRNGLQSAFDSGFAVLVELLDEAGNVVASTTSASGSGDFSITGVAPGTYRLRFGFPTGMTFHFTTQDAGDDALDSDADADGYTAFFTVGAGGVIDRDAGVYWVLSDPMGGGGA